MPSRILRGFVSLETEEQILNGGALVGCIGMFLPWISGEGVDGEREVFTGFGFYTSTMGYLIFLLLLVLLIVSIVPLLGGPVLIRRRHREIVRLCLAGAATLLIIAALSVLMNVTFEFTRMEIRFGVYVTLIGCLVSLLYAFLRLQEQRKAQAEELFHHPEDKPTRGEKSELFVAPPPPPPPPPPAPEEHRMYP
ncbi:MAG: hypothetical protein WCV62_03555 [Candidatus Peribacteraceae bacterium]|jgi:hypothetical protein